MPSPDERPQDFDVRVATADDTDAVLAALSDGYGRPFTREWFRWKHEESPWGASKCFVAVDEGGLLGVGFQMPWEYVAGGQRVQGWRMVDGATTVRAQRRGVFRKVVAAMLIDCAASEPKGVVLVTATPEARAAHIKNGADALEPIRSYYRPVLWRPGGFVSSAATLSTWQPSASAAIATMWTAEALVWRTDPRSGVEYSSSSLADGSAGAVHRLVGRSRTLVVSSLWGNELAQTELVQRLAWKHRALAMLAPAGPGARLPQPRAAVARGQSLLCVWDQRESSVRHGDARSGWALDGLDLEGVI
jgi:hypothetical protein